MVREGEGFALGEDVSLIIFIGVLCLHLPEHIFCRCTKKEVGRFLHPPKCLNKILFVISFCVQGLTLSFLWSADTVAPMKGNLSQTKCLFNSPHPWSGRRKDIIIFSLIAANTEGCSLFTGSIFPPSGPN